jgi:hypothetical protein
VLINPADLISVDLFKGRLGRGTIVLKSAGTMTPHCGLRAFGQITLSAAGKLVAAGLNYIMVDPLVVGGAGNDDVDLRAGVGRALPGGGDDLLRVAPGDVTLRSDGGAGRDTLFIDGQSTVTVHGGRNFEVVALANGVNLQERSVLFAGAAQDWTVTGLDGWETVTTGQGNYDLRLGGGRDTCRVPGGTAVTVFDDGPFRIDFLIVEATATGAFVSADLGDGADNSVIRGGRLVSIVESMTPSFSGSVDDVLDLSAAPTTTQAFAQLGASNDKLVFSPRQNALFNLGGGRDVMQMSAGNSAGSLSHAGGDTPQDTLVLVGPGWGPFSFFQGAGTRCGGWATAARSSPPSTSLSAEDATAASVEIISNGNSVRLKPCIDILNITLVSDFNWLRLCRCIWRCRHRHSEPAGAQHGAVAAQPLRRVRGVQRLGRQRRYPHSRRGRDDQRRRGRRPCLLRQSGRHNHARRRQR